MLGAFVTSMSTRSHILCQVFSLPNRDRTHLQLQTQHHQYCSPERIHLCLKEYFALQLWQAASIIQSVSLSQKLGQGECLYSCKIQTHHLYEFLRSEKYCSRFLISSQVNCILSGLSLCTSSSVAYTGYFLYTIMLGIFWKTQYIQKTSLTCNTIMITNKIISIVICSKICSGCKRVES